MPALDDHVNNGWGWYEKLETPIEDIVQRIRRVNVEARVLDRLLARHLWRRNSFKQKQKWDLPDLPIIVIPQTGKTTDL